jgi:hypothetical protein
MKRNFLQHQAALPRVVIPLTFLAYAASFAILHDSMGNGISALAVIPVIAVSWYLGFASGVLAAMACMLINVIVVLRDGHSLAPFYESPGSLAGIFALFLVAFVVGRFVSVLDERRQAILRLRQYENDRESHMQFLERLNQITAQALQADNVKSTLEILTEQIAHLFHADDAFFTYWDEETETPMPTIAYGAMKDIYPYVQFHPGDVTLSTSVMKVTRPIFVPNVEDSPFISPQVAALFPSRSMLGMPAMRYLVLRRLPSMLCWSYRKHVSWRRNASVYAN